MKFLLAEPLARAVVDRLRGPLAPDPHAVATGGDYRVTSTYFDSPAFAVYHRAAGYRVHKFRLRRYGDDPLVFLERKSKRGGRVWKRRTAVTTPGLAALAAGEGAWFAEALTARGLRPVCRVTYERTALVGAGPDGPVRLTLDRAARGLGTAAADVHPFEGGLPLLDGLAIVEFKFLMALPPLFKDAIAEFHLTPSAVSKYRRCIDTAGLLG
jgi:hypothetical protein